MEIAVKRLALFTAVIALVVLICPNSAYAVCQKCNNDNTANAMCWTLSMCEQGATMSACFVTETFNADGSILSRHCDSDGTVEGTECNGHDPSCTSSGGGTGGTGGPGGGGSGKGYVICVVDMFEPCDFDSCDECWAFCEEFC